jgi:hypothetical protein
MAGANKVAKDNAVWKNMMERDMYLFLSREVKRKYLRGCSSTLLH